MQVYTFDFICECQDFNHNEEFVLKEDLDSEMESKQKEITALEARGKKLTEITSDQSDLLDEVEDLFGQHMEQRWHEKIKRAREVLKDIEVE